MSVGRSTWKGHVRLSLVHIPVKAYSVAPSREAIHLNQLHRGCNARIRYTKCCPVHGEVPQEDIVSGYEFAKGQYVVIEDEALDKLKEPLTKIVDTIQVAVTQNKRALPNVPIQPVPEGPGNPPPPPTEPQKEESMILGAMKSLLPVLTNGAAKGSDPDLYVDFLLDQLPRPFYNQALSWLMEPDCLEQLAQKEPGIRYQQEWWSALRSGLVSALNEELGHGSESVQPQPASDPATDRSADL